MAPPLGRLGGRPFERRLSAEPTTAVARRDVAELLEPPLGLVPCERHPVAEQTFVIFVLKQDVLQGVPVVVRSRGREIGLQVGDEFVFVVVEPLGILDRQVEGDLLGRARRCGIPPDLEIRVEVVEGAFPGQLAGVAWLVSGLLSGCVVLLAWLTISGSG